MKYTVFTLFFLFTLLFYTPIYGQQIGELSKPDISVSLSPENPGPNEVLNISLESFSTNLDKSSITWLLNGQNKKSGKGEKAFSFLTGDTNTTTNISITIQTAEGDVVQKSLNIKPATVDLIWQSESFVPPFYKGKALFSHQNKITFIAIPHISSGGQEISSKNLIYKWKNNGSVIESASGYGKNTYTITGSIISRSINVTVEVSSSLTNTVGVSSINVKPIEPSVILYKKSPIYGIEFQKALIGTVDLENLKEVALVSMPYFFGVNDSYLGNISYRWSINGKPIDQDLNQTTRIFRPKEGVSGTSRISLKIESDERILQSAQTEFNLKFGDTNI